MVRIISTSSVPTSSGARSRAKAGAWQSGADGHAMRAVPVDEEDQATVIARRKALAQAETGLPSKVRKSVSAPTAAPPAAVKLF